VKWGTINRAASFAMVCVLCLIVVQFDTGAQATPAETGEWSAPIDIGMVGIHAILTHTGDVLFFEYPEGAASTDHTSRVRTWNYATGETRDASLGYDRDLFCAGNNVLPNGKVFSAGGHDYTTGKKTDGVGVAETDVYDPVTRRWTPGPLLTGKRWYPTNIGLPNGKTLIFGGQATKTELTGSVDSYDPATGTMTRLPSTATKTVASYPRMHLMPNGNLLKIGTQRKSEYFNPQTNRWTAVAPMLFGTRQKAATVLLPGLDKVMTMGGESSSTRAATGSVEILDTSKSSPKWAYTSPMNFPRQHLNAVTLPDGKVLVVGGGGSDKYTNPVKAAEVYDPVTGAWEIMASQQGGRMYHSTALLLPDGRVLSAGQDSGTLRNTAEIFSPPYLFRGSRPTITNAPGAVGYGGTLAISSPNAADIEKIALIRAGAVTHSTDTEQRYVGLNFSVSGNNITASGPVSANLAPPGYYMLFLVDSAGVPSVASWVQVG
jgi:hypothetical protein